ncbi:MAG TPA: Hsp20/alpha crystallin family protein [Terriglobia bacterium]|nr:Hsp20/alpha crystallin family protein [Terriglobia bacterium]
MNLVRWTPFHDMTLLQNQMNRLFDGTLQGWPSEADGTRNWVPPADIHETDNDLIVTTDLPGVDPKNIDVRVERNVLSITGERHFERKVENENFHRVERMYGGFARSFTLSTPVQADKIQATYKDGVLRISLPKAEQAKPKRIQIGATAA